MSIRLPLFPLGTVLFPGGLLPLHVFEPRYRRLMQDLSSEEPPEFGVVLIERGHEVGGGDVRARLGTVARVIEAKMLPDGRWGLIAGGTTRFVVAEFLADDPYPLAHVDLLADEGWDPAGAAALAEAERAVRRALAMAAELGERWAPAVFELPDDPPAAGWELCSLAPVGPHDRQALLAAPSAAARLETLSRMMDELAEVLAQRLAGG
jgi:hypothetical protein